MGIVEQETSYQLSNVYTRNRLAYEHPKVRYIVNQGGTRSGKTYSILQLLIHIAISKSEEGKPFFIDIARKNQTEIRTTVWPDFVEILTNWNIFNPRSLNKTNLTYTLNQCTFRFLGLDKAQKARGAKRDILYVNEANGITLEDWVQLDMRLTGTGKAFLDFNPSEEFWVHDYVLDNGDNNTAYIHSTYFDNKRFLPDSQVKTIENLIKIDDFYYKVYVLGELAELKGRVYEKYDTISVKDYDNIYTTDIAYGIDWGWNDPMTLIEAKIVEGKPYYRQLYYKSERLPKDLIQFMDSKAISRRMAFYADPSQPSSIFQMVQAGYITQKADNDILDGIKQVKTCGITICEDSTELLKERKLYKYQQDKEGKVLDKNPVDLHNHGLDAVRYIAYNHPTLKFINPNQK